MQSFILDRHTDPNNPVMKVTQDDKVPIYDSKADAEADIANIEEGAIVATKAGESEGVVFSPIGMISPFGGSTAPAGWLICDGSAISRTNYAKLFSVIGTAFGSGDGSTTFNLPDLSGKTTMGVETGHALGASENGALPNIKGHVESIRGGVGSVGIFAYNSGAISGSNSITNSISGVSGAPAGTNSKLDFNASNYNNIYSDDQTKVDPANVRVNYIIKY